MQTVLFDNYKDPIYRLSGSLTFANVVPLWKKTLPFFKSLTPSLIIDLSKLDGCDASGLALLLEWTRQSRQQKTSLYFVHPSASLLQLMILNGLKEILPIES
jgi:anti-anti-sigma factor